MTRRSHPVCLARQLNVRAPLIVDPKKQRRSPIVDIPSPSSVELIPRVPASRYRRWARLTTSAVSQTPSTYELRQRIFHRTQHGR